MTASDLGKTEIGDMMLGRYRLVRLLARGGMGAVCLARNEGAAGFVRPVVIKTSLGRQGDASDELFAREARILSSLRHPNIVGIVDFAEQGDEYVMVLEYVHGYTFAQWMRFARKTRGGLPAALAVYGTREVLAALEYAHGSKGPRGGSLGIVHRDVKPSNVLIDVQGMIKLADFGVARANAEVTNTSTGKATLKGTFAYMAPELFGGAEPSASSDVYSAAVSLYHMLAGRNPFVTKDIALTVARAMRHTPDRLDHVRADVSPALAAAIGKGMCKQRDGRFATAAEFSEALAASCPELDEAGAWFCETIQRDFHDPTFSALLGIDSLAEREAFWSDLAESRAGDGRVASPLAPSDVATVASMLPDVRHDATRRTAVSTGTASELLQTPETKLLDRGLRDMAAAAREPEVVAAAPARAPRSRLWVAAVVACVGAGAGAAFYFAGRGEEGGKDQTLVMVRGDVQLEGEASDAGVAAPAQASAVPDAAVPPERAPDTAPRTRPRPRSVASAVSATFRRSAAKLERCVEQYGPSRERLQVRFDVDTSGAVVNAELIPASAMTTELGLCVLRVARATQFGEQEAPMTFRIPIEVSHK